MKKGVCFMILFLTILSAHVQADFEVPSVQATDQWKVELLEPSSNEELAQAEKGVAEVYSLLVTNKGRKAYQVEVEAFRNEEGSTKMYGLAPQMEGEIIRKGDALRFTNFPVKEKTNTIEITVTWEDKPVILKDGSKAPGRKYKETFTFTPKG